MSHSPNSPRQRAVQQPNSIAIAEYNKLVAKGHFDPVMKVLPSDPTGRPDTPVGQFQGLPQTLSPAFARHRAPVVLPVVPSPPYDYRTRDPPSLVHAQPREISASPTAAIPPYVAPCQPPLGVGHTLPQGWTPPLVATTSRCATESQTLRLAFPELVRTPNNLLPQPQTVNPDIITYDGLCKRIQRLIENSLPTMCPWKLADLTMLSSSLANTVVAAGKGGYLGPDGLSSYSDIFVVVGYEGRVPHQFLGIAVMAPLQLNILLRTAGYDLKGQDPLKDEKLLAYLQQGFHNIALDALNMIKATINRSREL